MGNSSSGPYAHTADREFGSPKRMQEMRDGIENIKEGIKFVNKVLDEADAINKHLEGMSYRSLYSAAHFKRRYKETDEKKRENMFRILKLFSDPEIRGYREAEALVQLEEEFPEKELQELRRTFRECGSVEATMAYMGQQCLICYDTYPIPQMVSMLYCECQCCENCMDAHFTLKIREQSIYDMSCPICGKPEDLDENENVANDYFSNLQTLLRNKVKQDVYELFNHKVLQESLKDPNFKWCGLCDNGMLIDNLAERRMRCSACRKETCWECKKPWEKLHAGRSCKEFEARKKEKLDNEARKGIEEGLASGGGGIQCPQCKVYYELAGGGCMHLLFTCTNCRHEFCIGCAKPFLRRRCAECLPGARNMMHAHHPRICMFYLRDYSLENLQRLLQKEGVNYGNTGKQAIGGRCQVNVPEECGQGWRESACNIQVVSAQNGLCRGHYKEHLCSLIFRHRVDPIDILEDDNLRAVIQRANRQYPPNATRQQLLDIIRRQIPL